VAATPRNKEIASNADGNFYHLGLCCTLRTDLSEKAQYCGMFSTPTLRNVALRNSYFNNGVFHALQRDFGLYVTRGIAPEKWYSKSFDGKAVIYDDLLI